MGLAKLPCIICCSTNDLEYLFEYSLRTSIKNIPFLSEIFVVTPNPSRAKRIVDKNFSDRKLPISIIRDGEFLSNKESELCGWSKQQILKLRSNEISKAIHTLSIGADTVILKKLSSHNFYSDFEIIINYRQHKSANKHYDFEVERTKNIYQLLKINNPEKENLRDFIFDIFLFNDTVLDSLNSYLKKAFGSNYFLKIFPRNVSGYSDMVKIGEWSLYTIFLIEILKIPFTFKDASSLMTQIHTKDELKSYDYRHKAVHFVRKDFDKNKILQALIKRKIL